MVATTPIYKLPYLQGSDGGKAIAQQSFDLAQRLETTLVQAGQPPLSADLITLLTRLNSAEQRMTTAETKLATLRVPSIRALYHETNEAGLAAGNAAVRSTALAVEAGELLRIHVNTSMVVPSGNGALSFTGFVNSEQTSRPLGSLHNNGRVNVTQNLSSAFDWQFGTAGTYNLGFMIRCGAGSSLTVSLGSQIRIERIG